MSYAVIIERGAPLSGEFGESMARRLFGDDAVAAMGVIASGKNKGRPRGRIVWKKVERGGWVSDGPGYMNGHVERRVGKVVEAKLVDSDNREIRHWALGAAPDVELALHNERVRDHYKMMDELEDNEALEKEIGAKELSEMIRKMDREFWAAEKARGFKREGDE